MLDLQSIRTITLDIADTYDDGDLQDQAAEVILRWLSQKYQIYLFSSNPKQPVHLEDFDHPGLHFLREPMPPAPELAAHLTDLVSPANLWITDDPDIGRWLIQSDLPLATRKAPSAPGARKLLRYAGLGALAAAMDPGTRVMREVERRLALAAERPGARLVGIGGPPLSGFAEFALELKRHLESVGAPLVELLDLSSLLRGSDRATAQAAEASPFVNAEAGAWLLSTLDRVQGGEAAYVEALPPGVPEAFAPHLPLYLSPESIVLAFAEMPFVPPLAERFDVTVLLETTPLETTRRIYEFDEQGFDPKFTEQYLAHEGKIYDDYLARNAVRERAQVRVDANTPGTFYALEGAEAAAPESSR